MEAPAQGKPGSQPLLVFDTSALLLGKTREWQEFSRVGQCVLPVVVLEELKFLSNQSPDREQEHTAREFARFYVGSGWQVSKAQATHPMIKPATGQTVSKKARQSLAVAQATYGVSQEQPNKLVVLVANNQPMLKQIQALNIPNLCGITVSMLLEWVRSDRQPLAVTQGLRAIETSPPVESPPARSASAMNTATANQTLPSRQTTSRPQAVPKAVTRTTPTRPVTQSRSQAVHRSTSAHPGALSQMVSGALALAAVAIGGFFIWGLVQPAQFNQVWKQLGLPPLPTQQKPSGK